MLWRRRRRSRSGPCRPRLLLAWCPALPQPSWPMSLIFVQHFRQMLTLPMQLRCSSPASVLWPVTNSMANSLANLATDLRVSFLPLSRIWIAVAPGSMADDKASGLMVTSSGLRAVVIRSTLLPFLSNVLSRTTASRKPFNLSSTSLRYAIMGRCCVYNAFSSQTHGHRCSGLRRSLGTMYQTRTIGGC